MAKSYHEQREIKNTQLLREKIDALPPFCVTFFRGIADTTSSNTRNGYANDLKTFFNYLIKEERDFYDLSMAAFSLADLNRISALHIENYMDYISYYEKDGEKSTIAYQNRERGKARKLSAIRALFTYFYKKRKLDSNPAELVDPPKIHDKTITRLEVNEVAQLLDEVESGEKLTKRQQAFHQYTKTRDLAIMTLLLGTGIRVSECVGIDIDHLDFDVRGIKITRKGGNEVVIYFGEEVEEALENYLLEREKIEAVEGHENALFLSMQHKRISTRSVQLLVKKYAKLVTTVKNISPHKLRSTYGTNLYQETGDIYLVADVLGHKDVNTTRKHYADMEDSRRRKAAQYVKLRKED